MPVIPLRPRHVAALTAVLLASGSLFAAVETDVPGLLGPEPVRGEAASHAGDGLSPPEGRYGSNYTYECPSPAAGIKVPDPPWYVGAPISFDLDPSPCLERWTIDFGDGSPLEGPEGNRATHAYAKRGSYQALVTANFPDGVYVAISASIFVNAYAPPLQEADPKRTGAAYLEAPLYAAANLTHRWYLDNGLDWYHRPYSQLSFTAWWLGYENATYTHGQGGVTLHVLSLFDGMPLVHHTPIARASISKLEDSPINQVPPCQSGYAADMPSYAVTDLSPTLPSGWGFRSRVMGCGHDVFTPGKTVVTYCIEWDGELVPPMTPYLDGYLYDRCDVERAHVV